MRTKYRRGLDMVDKPKRYVSFGLLLLGVAAMILVPAASANPGYYSALTTAYGMTGNSCGTCHISTGGGGPLTGYGDMFLAQINLGKIPADALKTIGSPNGQSTKLSITVPTGVIAVTTGLNTIPKLGKATTSGGVVPVVITNDAPATGFPVGTHIVTWTATDSTGATVTDVQTVTIIDTLSPTPAPLTVVVPADVTAVTTGLTTTVNLGNVTTSGGATPISMVNDAPEVGFPVGTNTVTWTATDSLGAIANGTQKVTIINATLSGPPVVDGSTVPVVGVPTIPVIGVPVIGIQTVPEGNTHLEDGSKNKDLDDGSKNKDLDDSKVIASTKVNTEKHSESSEDDAQAQSAEIR